MIIISKESSDPVINGLMLKPVPASFEDQSVIILFQAMREDVKEIRKIHHDDVERHRAALDKIVGWDRCSTLRSQCCVENGEKFNDIFQQLDEIKEICADYQACKGNVVTSSSLSRAEGNVLDRARGEDGKILEEMEKIKKEVRDINDKLIIFNFSRCSLTWMWQNKKAISIAIGIISLWIFGLDIAARASCAMKLI